MVGLLLPLYYVFLYFSATILYGLAKKQHTSFRTLLTCLLYYFIFLQPDFIHQMLALISCRTINDVSYLSSDLTKQCYTADFYKYGYGFIVPVLILFSVLIPGLLFGLLNRSRLKLMEHKFRMQFGFLYKEYKQQSFYWEFVKMGEKLLIIYFLVYYQEFIKIKGILVFLTIFIYFLAQKVIQPYLYHKFNQIDYLSSLICSLTIILGVFLNENEFNYFIYIGYLAIICSNAFFVIYLVVQIIQGMLADKELQIRSLIHKFVRNPQRKQRLLAILDKQKNKRHLWYQLYQKHFGEIITLKNPDKRASQAQLPESQNSSSLGKNARKDSVRLGP